MTTARDEAGVSNVLGAILMFGLLVLTLAIIQARFVPVWTEDREARQMQILADDLRQLKSDLDRQAGNDTATPVTDSLPLRNEGGFQFFQQANLGATAAFVPSATGSGFRASTADPVQILRRNGQDLFAAGNLWDPQLDGTTDITDVLTIEHLRERIDLYEDATTDSYIGGPNTNDYDSADSVTLQIFASTDDVTPVATMVTTTRVDSGEYTFTIHLYNAAGEEVSSDSEALFQQVNLSYLYFDLMDSSLFLEPLLATAQPPFRLHLVESGLVADYQVVYSDVAGGGFNGAAGILDNSGYSNVEASGRLEIDARNQRFVDQTYVLEHGALVLDQGGDAAIIVPPNLGIGAGAAEWTLDWTLAGLQGDSITRTGERISAIASPTHDSEDVWLLARTLTLTLPTEHAEAWKAYLEDSFADVGWASARYVVTATSSSVVVDLQGPFVDTSYDISLRLRISQIDLQLAPG